VFLLSGGVDSSLVTALAARNQNQVNTYTITFPGHNKYDESNHSKLISNYFETNHREIEASEIDVKLLFELSTQFDEPIFDSSMIPTYLVTKTIRKYCKVALGGDGGDELFGGYSTYSRFLQLSRLKFLPLSIRKSISNFSSQILPSGYKGRNWFTHLDCDLDHFIPVPNSPFDVKERLKLYKHFNQNDLLHNRRELNFGYNNDIIQNATRFDFYNYLQEDYLLRWIEPQC
jgi:asparagine synthase (glutamine-hydrolysing)